ncbi:MAG: Fic family protein [Bacteroidota bacterium]|nr:Fic family protein [Bacteroidota bacterium]
MRRELLGLHVPTVVDGIELQALMPSELPPEPELYFNGHLQQLVERAVLALGRLDAVTTLLPNQALFVYSYVRKEAVLSSQIEGTQSSLSDLMLFEADQAPGVPVDDVTEVSNYVRALEYGIRRVHEGHPISCVLICEIHAILLSSGRGHLKDPGQFRQGQVWVGGLDPRTAVFMPPPPSYVPGCMEDFEQFVVSDRLDLTALVRAAVAHVQFETIHPFNDGNGRVGRLLIALMLCQARVLRQPLLYLSLYLKQNRAQYYDLLNHVRDTGDWESWLAFFLEGVELTASGAVSTTERLYGRFQEHVHLIQRETGRRAGSVLRLYEAIKQRPILPLGLARDMCGLTFRTTSTAMDVLVELGIVHELTGKKRNRFYAYKDYIAIINEGTETS